MPRQRSVVGVQVQLKTQRKPLGVPNPTARGGQFWRENIPKNGGLLGR